MSGYRKPYTVDEERTILHYIIEANGFYRLRGLEFWKELSRDRLPHRTYQSLHERFRKVIINNVRNPSYDLTFEEQKKIKTIYDELAKGRKGPSKTTTGQGPSIRTEVHGTLARDFFELSDSDDSDTDIPTRKTLNSESSTLCRKTSTSTLKDKVPSACTTRNELDTMEDNCDTENVEVSPWTSIRNTNSSVIELDSSSSDSEVFQLNDLHTTQTEN